MVSKSITKKKTNEIVKRELLNSIQENDDVKEQGLNETVSSFNNSQEAVLIIHHYKDIIKTENKKAIGYIGKQGKLFKKFKDTEHFYIKILLDKFLKKYPSLKKSIQQQSYFKNYFKAIKIVCKENPTFLHR